MGVRIQPEMAKRLDNWRRKKDDLPGRPEAIRRLVEIALVITQSAKPPGKKAVANASALAGKQIDRLHDKAATPEELEGRKQRPLKGPKEFRDIRVPKAKG